MKKFFIVVILLGVLLIAGYGISYFVSPVKSVVLEEYGHEIGITSENAYIVRDETVYYSGAAGTVYNSVAEGDRVSRDMLISTVYNGSVDSAALRGLSMMDDEIRRLSSDTIGLTAADGATAENEISKRMESIPKLASSNDIEKVHEYKNDINSLRSGDELPEDSELEALQSRRAEYEAGLSSAKKDIISDRSGIFSTYIDGLETILTPESVKTYDAEYIRSLSAGRMHSETGSLVAVGDPVCKVMNNHIWYILGITDSEHAAILNSAENITARFTALSDASARGTVEYVSEPDANGECLYLIQIPSYIDSAFSYRNLDADIIVEEYDGFKVPTEAIRTGEMINDYYVYATKGSDTYKCKCDVLYTDTTDGFSIIQSSEDAEVKLTSMERLIVGER
ncbi:MAG: HlyD family efflux transporter periplasmic adaptor subunit [Clostridiales bacterium]|nr:HlyD family efflux transporter periplasmic adaptor subunit [Clostridiales bacterium]